MQPDNTGDDYFLIDDPTVNEPWFRAGDAVSWLFPLLGLLAFEWFADPCLSVVIACLKFGYSDLKTGWWLHTHDPRGFRGIAVSLCYFSRGLYVVAATAFLIVAVMLVCEPLFNKNPLANLNSLLAGMVMWFLGLSLGTIFGGVAFHHVSQRRIRVWMDPTIHQARREKRFADACTGRRNQFHWLCLAVAAVVTGCMAMVMILSISARDWQVLLCGTIVFGIPAVWCLTGIVRSWPLAAKSPEDCWGESNRHA